jgi:hypothetical protein
MDEETKDLWLDCDLIEELRKAAQQILIERAKKRQQPPLKYGDVVGKTGWPIHLSVSIFFFSMLMASVSVHPSPLPELESEVRMA